MRIEEFVRSEKLLSTFNACLLGFKLCPLVPGGDGGRQKHAANNVRFNKSVVFDDSIIEGYRTEYNDWVVGQTVEELWLDCFQQQQIFLSHKISKPALGPNQPSIPKGTEGFFPAERRQGREVIHSLSPRNEVKNEWSCTSSSLYVSWRTQECPFLCSNFITARSQTNSK
jgi:hypothetical protein